MDIDRIKDYLWNNRQRFLDELTQFLRFPSISAQQAHDKDTLACAKWIKDRLAALGLKARLADDSSQPVVLAVAEGRSGRQVAIYGHYDVQPVDPLDQWHTMPFEPVIKDGMIFARGVSDDKGQLYAHVMAVEAILRTGGRLPSTVVFLLEGQEESGGDHLARFLQSDKDIRPEAVMVSDSSMYDQQTPALTYGLRGIVAMELIVKALAKDVHSGTYGGAVANPAIVLSWLLSRCLGPDGRIQIPGIYDDVLPLADWERENIRKLAFDDQGLITQLGAKGLFGEPRYSMLERMWARPTFEINGLISGYTGQGAKTIIPAEACAKISMRLVPDQRPERVQALVRDYLERVCPNTVDLQIHHLHASGPILFDIQHPMMRKAADALRIGFGRQPVFIRCGGSIPVVEQFVQKWQCPVLLMGFGQDSDGAHSPNEHFSIQSLFNGALASAALLLSL
ncbi:MAG: dipeptidase [Sedimentisphaerales bacterium]|nr:dipeptidase [Sedimentisphaerales bacterium]